MAKAFDEVPWSDWFEQWHPDFGQCRVREKVLRTGERYSEFFPKP